MKIGVITIQRSEVNFGACLQSYALWKFISNLGHDCEVIDLLRPCHSDYIPSPSFGEIITSSSHFLDIIKKIYLRLIKQTKNSSGFEKYHQFNNKVRYSPCYKSVEELYNNPPAYDILITGSDQVWNPGMPFINEPYFLTFSAKRKKISYASSFGVGAIPDNESNNYRKWLTDYSFLSTREQSGAEIIERLIGKRPQVVVDPTFLLTKEQWRKEQYPYIGLIPKNYILLYMLHYSEELLLHAERIAHDKGLPLYFVLSENRKVKSQSTIQLNGIGPAEWMWLIDNSSLLITNSFHGSAFSIIFNTPLAVFLEKGNPTNTRIEGLFSTLDMSDHVFDLNTTFDYKQQNFRLNDNISIKLEDERKKSIEFLNVAILND